MTGAELDRNSYESPEARERRAVHQFVQATIREYGDPSNGDYKDPWFDTVGAVEMTQGAEYRIGEQVSTE